MCNGIASNSLAQETDERLAHDLGCRCAHMKKDAEKQLHYGGSTLESGH
jgi:hypothetical protein